MVNQYWASVELLYLIDFLIFASLALHFNKQQQGSYGKSRLAMSTLSGLTTVLSAQSVYFALNTATDPVKLGILPNSWFPVIDSLWIVTMGLLGLAGLWLVLTLARLRQPE